MLESRRLLAALEYYSGQVEVLPRCKSVYAGPPVPNKHDGLELKLAPESRTCAGMNSENWERFLELRAACASVQSLLQAVQLLCQVILVGIEAHLKM
jgi:hypothetical protein